jgi:hypothetical protein
MRLGLPTKAGGERRFSGRRSKCVFIGYLGVRICPGFLRLTILGCGMLLRRKDRRAAKKC